jgi:hypothetical protein
MTDIAKLEIVFRVETKVAVRLNVAEENWNTSHNGLQCGDRKPFIVRGEHE